MAKQCDLIIGYLLPRRCEGKAVAACTKCGRNACDRHTRMGDAGLLCRDCYEEVQPLTDEQLTPLPEPVQQVIYRREGREGLAILAIEAQDYQHFEAEDEEEEDAFSTLT